MDISLLVLVIGIVARSACSQSYAFEEGHYNSRPPKVRKPPYRKTEIPCPGESGKFSPKDTLCGDLNQGFIPKNPLGQLPQGEPYPFELIRNKTLEFFARTLPYLRENPKIPKVAKVMGNPIPLDRRRRYAEEVRSGVCNTNEPNMFCSLSRYLNSRVPLAVLSAVGDTLSTLSERSSNATTYDVLLTLMSSFLKAAQQSDDNSSPWKKVAPNKKTPVSVLVDLLTHDKSPFNLVGAFFPSSKRRRKPSRSEVAPAVPMGNGDLPPTPCPSLEEYVTPTYARNYQGVWKYVVQIPQEGYFTQTVQNIKCLRSRCDFTDGVCHESPRWVSLLVAEIFYPNHYLSAPNPDVPPVDDFNNFQQYLRRRVGPSERAQTPAKCDGHDQVGCYLVRLYYDWFLVNGSCKCWKPGMRHVFARRKPS